MINPETITIQGDISRQDVMVLASYCTNKNVVEFGVGGSTLIIARCAKSLMSYDTDQNWIDITSLRLSTISDKTCEPQLKLISQPPNDIEECDVLFIDGLGDHRDAWAKLFTRAKVTLIHDSLGVAGDYPVVYWVMKEIFNNIDSVGLLDKITFHCFDSNMVVVERRDSPLSFRNWNETETTGRISPY